MANSSKETQDSVRASISSIYSGLLEKRKAEKEAAEEAKRIKKEEEEAKKKEAGNEEKDEIKLTKKEKRQKEIDNWKQVVIGLTGDDLEYEDEKKRKKKYKKWIDDDAIASSLEEKPKKPKKKNYNKEFQAELNMLKSLLADQNKFTNEIQKRLQIMMGPNTKDAGPLNKTEVELASAVISSRNNSLGYLKEIGAIKKTIADLYLRQKKQDYDMGSGDTLGATTDLGLLGSSIASAKFGDNAVGGGLSSDNPYSPNYTGGQQMQQVSSSPMTGEMPSGSIVPQGATPVSTSTSIPGIQVEVFDPESWNGEGSGIEVDPYTKFESVPKQTVVEWNKEAGQMRFKAIRTDTGEELVGCPVPTSDPGRLTVNEKDGFVKGEFDETYPLVIV